MTTTTRRAVVVVASNLGLGLAERLGEAAVRRDRDRVAGMERRGDVTAELAPEPQGVGIARLQHDDPRAGPDVEIACAAGGFGGIVHPCRESLFSNRDQI